MGLLGTTVKAGRWTEGAYDGGSHDARDITIEDTELLERYAEIVRCEGETVDELTTEAVKRDVARRWFENNNREARLRGGNMTDEEVEAVVEKAIQGV